MLATTRYGFAAALFALAWLLGGCGGGGPAPGTRQAGELAFTVEWPEPSRLIPLACTSITAVLSRDGQAPVTRVLDRPASGNQTTVSFTDLAAGPVTLTATAYPQAGGQGVAQATGSAPATIVSGETRQVTVTMASAIDRVEITPTNPLLRVGQSIDLTLTAYNASGQVVLVAPSNVTWQSPDTARVSLNPTAGTVVRATGVSAGAVDVGATETESGKSDTAAVTVQDIDLTSPWPSFGGNAQHTGRGLGSGAVGLEKWQAGPGTYITSSPAIAADGTVYISMGYTGGSLSALNPVDGTPRWAFPLANSHNPNSVTPAIGADGTVYCGGNQGAVYAVNPADGTQRWVYDTGEFLSASPTLAADGTVLIGVPVFVPQDVSTGKLLALDPTTGALKWEFATTGGINDPAAIGPDGTIYVRSDRALSRVGTPIAGTLLAIDPVTHLKKWEFALGQGDYGGGAPSVGADGTVYIAGGNDASFFAVNPADGTQKWEFVTGGAVRATAAVGSDGAVYFTSFDGKVYAVNGQTGQKKWEYLTQGTNVLLSSSPAIALDNTLYFVTRDDKLTALNGSTGQFLWEVAGASHESSPALAADGSVYVGGVLKAMLAVR